MCRVSRTAWQFLYVLVRTCSPRMVDFQAVAGGTGGTVHVRSIEDHSAERESVK